MRNDPFLTQSPAAANAKNVHCTLPRHSRTPTSPARTLLFSPKCPTHPIPNFPTRSSCCCCFSVGLDGSVCPQHQVMQRQSLRLIDMGQCPCTDPYPTSHLDNCHPREARRNFGFLSAVSACMGHNLRHRLSTLLCSA